MKSKKVILAGGTGQIGRVLEKEYLSRGYKLFILTRQPKKNHHVFWDGIQLGSWSKELEGSDLLINLSGRSILSRDRLKVYNSRINSTKALGKAIESLSSPPKVWLQMSAAGLYSHRFEGFDDEFEGKLDSGASSSYWKFIIGLAQDWEQAFYSAPAPATRKVIIRMSFFMSADQKGFFGLFSRLARSGLGGSLAGGEQFISWIHEEDLIAGIDFILRDPSIDSPVNFSSPQPLSQKEFMRILRDRWNVSFGLSIGKRMLKLAGFFTGAPAELILKSSRVYPAKLLKHGFEFKHPDWESASADLVKKYREL